MSMPMIKLERTILTPSIGVNYRIRYLIRYLCMQLLLCIMMVISIWDLDFELVIQADGEVIIIQIDINLQNGSSSISFAIPGYNTIWDMNGCTANGKIYFFGGHTGVDKTEIYELDPVSNQLTMVANMTDAANGVTATLADDGWIYYWEGQEYASARNIERFNPLTYEVDPLNAHIPATNSNSMAI